MSKRSAAQETARDIVENDDTMVTMADVEKWSDKELYLWLKAWSYEYEQALDMWVFIDSDEEDEA